MADVVTWGCFQSHLESHGPVESQDPRATEIIEPTPPSQQLTKPRCRGMATQQAHSPADPEASSLASHSSHFHYSACLLRAPRFENAGCCKPALGNSHSSFRGGAWVAWRGSTSEWQEPRATLLSSRSHTASTEVIFDRTEAKESEGRRTRGVGRRAWESHCLGANPNCPSKTPYNEFASPCLSFLVCDMGICIRVLQRNRTYPV